ncbi:hypothetical protein AWB67_07629 [Caballeronia terrestris]|uniref:Uncharacterized protein n=1 Tax=Caballeronia terrestris TaxID=1226301 RepID=A0A158L5A4_9BURK|nr:hypothetical protein AWB67_07629 [Caballeronia terrestris]
MTSQPSADRGTAGTVPVQASIWRDDQPFSKNALPYV